MGTTIVGTLTAEQMQQEAAKQKTMADAAAAPTTKSALLLATRTPLASYSTHPIRWMTN